MEVFNIILMRSMTDRNTVSNVLPWVHLSRKDAKEVLRLFFQIAQAKGINV